MKTLSFVSILTMLLGLTTVSLAGNSNDAKLHYVEFSQLGNPAEVLKVKTESARSLQSGEVRVKVLATPIHPSNLLQISGNYGVDPTLPSTPGSEGVGRVIETSAEVTHLKKGQLVLLVGGGTWRDEIVAPAAGFLPLPDLGNPSSEVIEQLSMTAVNPLSALLMLTSFVELKEGDWIVHSAANSSVGGYIIQLAKQRGVKTVNIVRREGLAKDLMAKGGDVVLIDGPDLAQQIGNATGNAPISLGIDAVGGATFTRLAQSLANGGTMVSYGVLSGQPVTLNPAMTIFNDIRIRGFWLSKWFETSTMEEKQAAFGGIIPMIASGALKADVDSRFTVSEIKQAVTRAAQRGRNGKVLIVPNAN
ncbi:alcohol dehydrogenase [Halieaceae bacterium IMCC14734]|uniref:enoyl-[acyl-carrier-protein] reductase n=1 Tax=Candidatus Litorirhabdus singularis TaxID=2518993 RepID=A0ABT3THB9_9GAMM|nr:zinc-dependent alcohol dehydrogenase family protein [Candidatus Litorirhabdus singularis]MCX2981136.1 alcohol dehydrogenase [Candidatus Litorirhabdus singularis]